jgi:metal-responsive CopG/Arc/MetJ family transcriptional regulator
MRLHISLERELVEELDRRAGQRHRSAFIAALIRRALDDENRWDEIEAALGSIAPTGHPWDEDAASWVRSQRETDTSRAG